MADVAVRCRADAGGQISVTTNQPADSCLAFWARRVLAFPNLLTLVRIPLAALLWLRPDDLSWMLLIVAIAAATDAIDGRIAHFLRHRGPSQHAAEDEAVGAWLDPLCDKVFTLAALGALWYGFDTAVGLLALTVLRELALAPLIAVYHLVPSARRGLRFDFRADWLGKLTTALQFAVVAAILLIPNAALPLAFAAATAGIVATARYLRRGLVSARTESSQFGHVGDDFVEP